jgi:5-methylcytosine-specific restriction endonuclease McrA
MVLMARWNRTTKWKRKMIERIAARDGMLCWLCALPLSLVPKKPSKRISLEHLVPRSLGGDDKPENLVLCHQHCNGHLRDRPIEKKQQMRKKWLATRARLNAQAAAKQKRLTA